MEFKNPTKYLVGRGEVAFYYNGAAALLKHVYFRFK